MTDFDFENNSFINEALSSGVDLTSYIQQINNDLAQVNDDTISDALSQIDNLNSLYSKLQTTDQTLETIENVLTTFQDSLGTISSEIQHLQDSSLEISSKLKNRQDLHQELAQFVDELVVSESLIEQIMVLPVTDQGFIEALHELNHKIKFVREQKFAGTNAAGDVESVIEKLKFKAIAKIREFMLQKILSFRRPLTNYQIPQNALLKHRFFYEFLLNNDRITAEQIQDEYIETTSKIQYSYFNSYMSKLWKLKFKKNAGKNDLIGKIETKKTSAASQITAAFTRQSLTNRGSVFTLGERAKILKELEASVIVPHAETKVDAHYHYEMLFRSMNYAFLENACREYLFIKDFFLVDQRGNSIMFQNVMGKTMELILSTIRGHLLEMYDTIGMFLCLHIVYRFQIICHKRQVTALEDFWDSIIYLLEPKIEDGLR